VPKERDGVPSVAAEATGGDGARCRGSTHALQRGHPAGGLIWTGESADLLSRSPGATFRCCFGDEARDDFDSITRFAEVVRTASNTLVPSDSLHPLGAVHLGLVVLDERRNAVLLALMTAKQRQLSEERRQRGRGDGGIRGR